MDWTTDSVGGGQKEPRLDELVDKLVIPDGEAKEGRFIGPARRVARHWLTINKKAGGTARIPFVCLAWNDDSGKFDNGECPFCALDPKTPGIEVHQNFIDRDAQANEPRRVVEPSGSETRMTVMKGFKCYLKSGKASRSYTPVRLAVLNSGHSNPIKDMVGMNKKKVKGEDGVAVVKVFGPEHPQNGFDVSLLYNSQRAAAQRYNAIKGENTPLEPHERRYLLWDIYTEQPKSLEDAKIEAKRLAKVLVVEDGDEAPAAERGGGKGSGKPKRETTIDDDEDWDSDDVPVAKSRGRRADPDEDELDDEPPARRGKPAARRADPDEDDLDDEPAPRRAAKPAARRSRDEDLDDEPAPRRRRSEPEDDFDDEPAPRRAAKPAARRRPEPEDDFDDEPPARSKPAARRARDEDDLDDEPAPRRGTKPKPRRPEPDDDDLGDDDDWDE